MIIGAGKLGYKLAKSMINNEYEVTLIDNDAKVIERMNDHLDVLTVTANGLEVAILRELHISTYDLLIASTGSDETNTIICTLAKKLGCKITIARLRNPEYTLQLDFIKKEMGIDHIINSDLETANEIARYLTNNEDNYSGEFASGLVQMIEFNIRHIKGLEGKKITELDNFSGLLIIAILRDNDIIIPNGATKLMKGDILHLIGTPYRIDEFRHKNKIVNEFKAIKRVMIIGGGNVGYYLAEQLIAKNVNVAIVEQDRARCKQLTYMLTGAMIIHGDGTDIDLLEEESLSNMDAFVGVTGYDEQNLLMSLMAKQTGVRKAVAKISRPSYINLVDRLGIDMALNPINIAVSDILKYIRGRSVASVSLMLGDKAELTEILVEENEALINKKIVELNLPKGIIIGAIVHDEKVVIPNGNTVIHEYDRLIIFTLVKDTPALDIFYKPATGGMKRELWHRHKGTR